MKILDILQEEINEPAPYRKHKNKNNVFFFKTNGNKYKVSFFKPGEESSYKISAAYELEFYKFYEDLIELAFGIIDGGKTETAMTGTGHVKKVFSTVKDICKEYISTRKPKYLMIKAHSAEKSRIKFYDVLYNNHERYLPDYEKAGTKLIIGEKVYLLKRK